MSYNIGVDVGGTFIKCAVVDDKLNIISSGKIPTPEGALLPETIVMIMRDVCGKSGLDFCDISSVGVGTTGVCDASLGVVISCANIKGYENIAVCDYIEKHTKIKAYLDNDANCAALGEYAVLEDTCDNFLFVTLGTGIGGGIILNGRLLRGVNGAAGEIGHMTFVPGGEKCGCGKCGCWEKYASVSALVRQTKEAGFLGEVDGRTAFAEAESGNKKAISVLEKWLGNVADGICSLVNILQPETVVIGGGVSREGEKILSPVREYVEKNAITRESGLPVTKIRAAKLFNDAGIIGASILYTQQ